MTVTMHTSSAPDGNDPLRQRERTISLGSLHYHPESDSITMEVNPHTEVRIEGGRAIVDALNALMAKVEEAGESEPVEAKATCPLCGDKVIESRMLNGQPVVLDAAPNQRGVYLFARKGRLRTLRPFEEPMVPTYRKHRCEIQGAE